MDACNACLWHFFIFLGGFMAQYDGSIRINTQINVKSAEAQLGALEVSISKSANKIADLRSKLDSLKTAQIPTQEYSEIAAQIEKAQHSLDVLLEKQERMQSEGKTSGTLWERINSQIAETRSEINYAKGELQSLVTEGKAFTVGDPAQEAKLTQKLQSEEARLQSMTQKRDLLNSKMQAAIGEEQRLTSIKENATVADQKMVDLIERRRQLVAQIKDMEKSGVTEGYAEYDNALADLSNVQGQINGIRDMRDAATQARTSYVSLGESVRQAGRIMARGLIDIPITAVKAGVRGLVSAFQELGGVVRNVASGAFRMLGNAIKTSLSKVGSLIGNVVSKIKLLGSTAKKSFSTMNKSAKKSGGIFSNFSSRLKGIISSLLIFNWITKAFNAFTKSIKDGFGNLYKDNDKFKTSVDNLRASVLTLKNAFAAAFRPLVDVAIPYIQMAADKLTELLNKVGQFTAAITGQSTYTKAIKQTADAFKDAKKAAEGYLSPLDEINKFSSKKDAEDEEQTGIMFEEVPIEQKFKDLANKLKDMWKNADFYDFGKNIGEKLKESLDSIPWDKIKEASSRLGKSLATLINGFTEVEGLGTSIGHTLAEAINTAFEFLNSFVHNLHWESIGKFIADSINGLLNGIDWELIYDTFVTGAKGLGDAINSFVDNLDWDAVSSTIANFVNTFVDTVYTFFTTVDWAELGTRIGETLTETIKKIDFEKVGRAIGSVIQAAIDFLKNFISELSFEDIVNAITDALKGFFEEANWEDIAKIALSLLVGALVMQSSKLKLFAVALAILTAFQDELIALDWEKAGEVVGEYFIKFFNFLTDTIENIDWYALGQKVKEFLVGIDWNGVTDAFFEAVGAAFGGLFEFLYGIIEEAWDDVVQWWHDTAYEDGEFTIQGLLDGIADVLSNIGEWIKEHIFSPFMEGFRNVFGIHSPSTVMAEQGGFIIEGMLNGILDALKSIGSWIKEHIFHPFIDGFKSAFGIHSPSTVMSEMGGYIIEGLLNGLKNMWSSITTWIEDKVGWIIDKFQGIKDKISGFFSGGGSGDSGQNYSTRSYSMRSIESPYAANPAFSALSSTPIPRLATGAVIPANKEFLAVLGDQKHGTNIEAPLDTIKQAAEEAILNVFSRIGMSGGNMGGTPVNLTLQVALDGQVLGQKMVDWGKLQEMATGRNPYGLGTT